MAEPYVRDVGQVTDIDEWQLTVGTDYDTVSLRIGAHSETIRLGRPEAEEFAQLFIGACWAAGANAERMRAEAAEGGGGG